MRRLGRAVAGLGILLLLAGATMSFAGWRMGGESWLEIEAAGHIVSLTPFGIRSWNEKGRRGAESLPAPRRPAESGTAEVSAASAPPAPPAAGPPAPAAKTAPVFRLRAGR